MLLTLYVCQKIFHKYLENIGRKHNLFEEEIENKFDDLKISRVPIKQRHENSQEINWRKLDFNLNTSEEMKLQKMKGTISCLRSFKSVSRSVVGFNWAKIAGSMRCSSRY